MAVLSGLRSAREDYLLYLVSTYLGRHRGVIKSPLLDSVHVCLIYTIWKDSLNGDFETTFKS